MKSHDNAIQEFWERQIVLAVRAERRRIVRAIRALKSDGRVFLSQPWNDAVDAAIKAARAPRRRK